MAPPHRPALFRLLGASLAVLMPAGLLLSAIALAPPALAGPGGGGHGGGGGGGGGHGGDGGGSGRGPGGGGPGAALAAPSVGGSASGRGGPGSSGDGGRGGRGEDGRGDGDRAAAISGSSLPAAPAAPPPAVLTSISSPGDAAAANAFLLSPAAIRLAADTGPASRVSVASGFVDDRGRPCRVIEQRVTINGEPIRAVATVCQRAEGDWRLVP